MVKTVATKTKLGNSRKKVAPKLDILGQFSTHASSLMKAVDVGGKIHSTGNIAESGGPFETAFRSLFSYALPSTFLTTAGYFFGLNFELSGQVDFLLCDETDVLRLPPQAGMVTGYVPYRSVKAIGQLKNTFTDFKSALDQTALALNRWKEMASVHHSGSRKEPLAVVVIGKGGSDVLVRKAIASFKGTLPAYILLVEKGLLYGREGNSLLCFDDASADYSNQGNGGPLALLEAETPNQNDRGRMLMWLFFGVLLHAIQPKANTTLQRIVERAQALNPVKYSSDGTLRSQA